jgi:hypothetical protein
VIIPASSGTIAAGVISGFLSNYNAPPRFLVHLVYSRSHDQVLKYLREKAGLSNLNVYIVDEKYSYKDKAKGAEKPPWPCNEYYDLKAFQWWLRSRREWKGATLFWNIG